MDRFAPFLVVVICYLLGSVPSGYVICRLHGVNIFKIGSGNMGATNATRAIGLRWGGVVLLLDLGKGILAVAASRWLMPLDALAASILGAVAVVIGHNWSLLASLITGTLRGGKGAATAAGTWLMLIPPQIILLMLALWGLLILGTRYMSLAVLIAFGVGTLWVVGLSIGRMIDPIYSTYAVLVSALVYYRHKENIVALLHGRERRFMDSA